METYYTLSQIIHVWYIYLQNWVIYGVNVSKYASTMDDLGIILYVFLPGKLVLYNIFSRESLCSLFSILWIKFRGNNFYHKILWILYPHVLYQNEGSRRWRETYRPRPWIIESCMDRRAYELWRKKTPEDGEIIHEHIEKSSFFQYVSTYFYIHSI